MNELAAPAAARKDGELRRILHRQHLVVSRAQALICGMTPDAVRHRIRAGGPWQRLLPGVYLTVTGTPTLLQKEVAAVLHAGPASVLTGLAALRRHGLRVPEHGTMTVLVPAGQPHSSHAFVRVRPTTRMPERVCYQGAVRFTLPERAVADAASELGSYRQMRALVADAVQQRRCKLAFLREELAGGPVRGSAWLRRCLAEVADGIRSGAEGDFADLIHRSGLPVPMFNPRLYTDQGFLAKPDAWWPDAGVAAEVDSREWHLSPDQWQYTLRRHARMGAHGIIVVHITPAQIRAEPQRVAADIGAALAVGRARPPLAVRARPAEG